MKKKLLGFLLTVAMTVSTIATGVMAAPANTAKVSTPTAPNYPYRNVMYYGDWSVYGGQHMFDPCDMQGNLITHLNFAFMDFDANGELVLCDPYADFEKGLKDQGGMPYGAPYTGVIGGMIGLRDKNPNLKIGVSVGGWTRCGDFSAVCASDSKRANLVNNLMKFIDYVGFDFVDIDWEYPGANRKGDPEGSGVTIDEGCPGGPQDTQNFTKLMRDLRAGLDELGAKNGKYYELSAAMSAAPAMMDYIEYDKVLQYADFINMMTYDLNGAWAPFTAHQSPLYTNPAAENLYDLDTNAGISIDSCVNYLKDKYNNTLDMSKIVVGVCAYTRGWGGVHNDGYAMQGGQNECPGLFATSKPNSIVAPDKTTSGTWAYGDVHEIKSRYNLKEYWDDVAKAPYLYSPGTGNGDGYFFTYDNPKSAALKGQYVKENGLGGLICWMASQDPNEEITTAMKESLYGSAPIPEQPIIVGKADVTVDVAPAENGTISVTLKNNSKAVERNDALKRAELYQKTIMLSRLYIDTVNNTTFRAGSMAGTVTGNCVDLAPLYDASTLKPGASHTFTLVPNDKDFKIEDIKSITLTQRKQKDGAEFGEQIVYGDENYDPTVVSGVKLDQTSLKMTVGDTVVLNETVTPASAADKSVTWDSSDEKVVTVKDGKVTAVDAGAAVVTVTTKDGKFQATCRVTVTDPNKVSSVEVSKKTLKLEVGKEATLEAKVLPTTVKDKDIVWSSSDEKVATVVNGKVKAVAEGTATIKALNKKSGKFAVCTLTVVAPGKVDEGNKGDKVDGILPDHMVTGYWHNFCNGSTNLKLSDVPDYYDMICVAFTENQPTKNGLATFKLDDELCAALGGYTDEEFIQDIQDLKAKGQHVIISVGGAEGRIIISSEADAKVFADSMIKIIDKYGFEGVDIDLEGSSVAGTQYIASALRELHDHYGKDFIITMAPETLYIMTPQATYAKLAMEIKDILTICYPQFYNTGSMNGYQGAVVNPGTADMMTSMSTTLIEDCGLRPDQIGFGVPAMSRAGGNCPTIAECEKAVNAFVNGTKANNFKAPHAYPGFRSMMTWSINWDATQDYKWAKHMSALMDSLGGSEGYVPTPEPVASVTLNKTNVTLNEGASVTLQATIKPANADNRKLTWKTSNPAVATVNNGKVVAVKEGKATITVSSANGKTSSCVVTVKAKETVKPDPDPKPDEKPDVNPDSNEWDPNKVYNGGAKVTYQGEEYTAKWWTQGDRPDTHCGKDDVWRSVNGNGKPDPTPTPDPDPTPTPDPDPTPTPDPDPTPTPDPDPTPSTGNEWKLEGTYKIGDVVTYQGREYKCQLGHTAYATDWNPRQAGTLWAAK